EGGRGPLGVGSGAGRRAPGFAAGNLGARRFDRLLEGGIHHGRCAGAKALDRDAARTPRGRIAGHALEPRLKPGNHGRIIVADLEQHFRRPRDDARRARIERDAACGPYRAGAAQLWKGIVDGDAESGKREPRVLANGHSCGAGMILRAGEGDAVLPDADDRCDDTDLQAATLQRFALLDMSFEVTEVPPALDARARSPGKTDRLQRLAHAAVAVAVARRVDIGFGHVADIGPGAEEMAEMAFLVAPCGDFDGAGNGGIAIENARGLECVDNAQGSVEPAGKILALEVRAREQLRTRLR